MSANALRRAPSPAFSCQEILWMQFFGSFHSSVRWNMLYKIGLLKGFGNRLGKHLCHNFFLGGVAHHRACNFVWGGGGDFGAGVLLWVLWKCWGHFVGLLRWVLLILIRPSWPLGRGGVFLHFAGIAFFGCF